MEYEIDIAGLKRNLPLFAVNDEITVAAFILFGDVEMTEHAATKLLEKAPEFDIILTAEAKAISLVYEMARQKGQNDFIVARKKRKVYMREPVVETSVDSITTAGIQELCLGQDEIQRLKDKRVLIVDDVVSTGESLKSLRVLCELAGIDNIVGQMFVLAEGDACNRDDVIFLEKLPLFDAEGNPKL